MQHCGMVKEIKKENNLYYLCEACEFVYKEKELAEKCQAWCEKYKSCNIKITKHAVKL